MKKLKDFIPNLLTLSNLVSGALAIHFLYADEMIWMMGCFFLSLIFDFLDGFAARLLKAESGIGKELDSLSDMVSFGLFPALIMFDLLRFKLSGQMPGDANSRKVLLASFPAFLLLASAALRLAVFNTNDKQKNEFQGLATPASALFVVGLFILKYFGSYNIAKHFDSVWVLYICIIFLSIFMNVPIALFKMKWDRAEKRNNRFLILFLALCLLLLLWLKQAALPFLIIAYIFVSLIKNIFANKTPQAL